MKNSQEEAIFKLVGVPQEMLSKEEISEMGLNKKEFHQATFDNIYILAESQAHTFTHAIARKEKSIGNQKQLAQHLSSALLGLSSLSSPFSHELFEQQLIQYPKKGKLDLILFLNLFALGLEAFSQIQQDTDNQDKAEVLSEKKYQKKEQKDSLLERCFQEVWNYDVKNNYKGKGQGSGCSFFHNNCPKLKNSCNHKVFCQKYAEWKKRTEPVASQKIPEESLAECKKDGIRCTKKP